MIYIINRTIHSCSKGVNQADDISFYETIAFQQQTRCICQTQMTPKMAKVTETNILIPVEIRYCQKNAYVRYKSSYIYNLEITE